MLKARCDLGANTAARPQEGPGAIQAIRDRMFRPKWHVALTTVDALTDLPALQGDVIIHKTPHHSIVARETTTTQGLTFREIVYEEERPAHTAWRSVLDAACYRSPPKTVAVPQRSPRRASTATRGKQEVGPD